MLYALRKWWPLRRTGAYLVIGMSAHAPTLHFMVARDLSGVEIEEFVPRRPKRGWRGFLHSFYYTGHARRRVIGAGRHCHR